MTRPTPEEIADLSKRSKEWLETCTPEERKILCAIEPLIRAVEYLNVVHPMTAKQKLKFATSQVRSFAELHDELKGHTGAEVMLAFAKLIKEGPELRRRR